ncbi:dTDP-4-dehydrorhamnose reductase [Pseudochrobactrum sp. B5]|uniref:dTDP-4-dehydrorhamnose reductase n=1 Tax=Pseudochrobactrum sp. B5 TaxID=1289478 RepID=UPI0009524045|nr:dTDP-4-dehydrorhamnose reductase [Pseudochrobactrum sp. B5]
MKIAVTGKNGQVVQSLLARDDDGFEIIALGRPELDLAAPETIYPALAAVQPDLVISAAAYTAVDKAEDEPDLAFAINAIGAGAVSKAAAKLNIPIIHISTDYVFDGTAECAYVESDMPNPQNVYGISKLEGERLVALNNQNHLILRTSWVYSPFGNNFMKTILRLSENRSEIQVVFDQVGNPTSALEIASAILHVLKNHKLNNSFNGWGVYNFSGGTSCCWADFAERILNLSVNKNEIQCRIVHIPSESYPTRAKRPMNSRLSNAKFNNSFNYKSLSLDEAIRDALP